MDIIAPCLMIGLGIGRVGCFLNGCCYGEQCNVAWGVRFPYFSNAYLEQVQRGQIVPDAKMYGDDRKLMSPDELKAHYKNSPGLAEQLMAAEREKVIKVQPAELYSTFTALLLAALLVAYFSLPHVPGNVFALMCILEGASRFMLEMLRVEPPILHSPLSLSMWLGVVLVIGGAALWFEFSRAGGPQPRRSNPRPCSRLTPPTEIFLLRLASEHARRSPKPKSLPRRHHRHRNPPGARITYPTPLLSNHACPSSSAL